VLEAIVGAKLASSRWSVGSAIARRSFGRRTVVSGSNRSRARVLKKTRKEGKTEVRGVL
jgi:hypothetical protein